MKIQKLYLGALIAIISIGGASHVFAESKGDDDNKGTSASIGFKIGVSDHEGDDDRDESKDKDGEYSRGVYGSVTAVNGTTISVRDSRTNVVYTVDTTKAKIDKNRVTILVSGIAVGDMVLVEGTTTGTAVVATSIHDGVLVKGSADWKDNKEKDDKNNQMMFPEGNGQPIVGGTVTAVNASQVTITNKSNVSYTIDVINAKVTKAGKVVTKADIMVGDTILAQGTVNGTTVVAVSVIDQGVVSVDTTHQDNGKKVGFFRKIGNFFSRMFGSHK